MIKEKAGLFRLITRNTLYAFRITDTFHAEHLYYGRKITIEDDDYPDALIEKKEFIQGNTNAYDEEHKNFTLEDVRLEMSSYGKGDIREPFVHVVHGDGSSTSDFLYDSYKVDNEKEDGILPGSYSEDREIEHLQLILKDRQYNLTLQLNYYVYEWCDVITRNAVLINDSGETVKCYRLMSSQLDLDDTDYVMTTFNGAWAREMQKHEIMPGAGRHINYSMTGTSSSRANPFVMLAKNHTFEDYGSCYGFNLIYSGNHYESVEVSSYGKTRFINGINPDGFCYVLESGERLEAPEAVMTYAYDGYNGISRNMHRFIRNHIVRGKWKNKVRPVLMNSWEAAYFDIDERKLINLAQEGKRLGIELFVMDDGWFGRRNDDTTSLGDWFANEKKLPGGIKGIADKINGLGLDFGIWVEPEMVSVESELYKKHPEWVIEIPGKPHSEGRHQRILDLTRSDVQDYIIKSMSEVFSSGNISYVKWDMNRTFTDVYSRNLPPDRQGEVIYRYYAGLYRCMRVLTEKFPDILFEGCSAGGNRFDLGILCYFPQIWASDNTDALCRSQIQYNYFYGYPQSVISAHVSASPNHQTLRRIPLETRFNVAAFGICGYECNFNDMKKEELDAVKEQIRLYKKWRRVLQFGRIYRGRCYDVNSNGVDVLEMTCVSNDKKKAVGIIMQRLVSPNSLYHVYKPCGLIKNAKYHLYNRKLKYNIKEFGDLINTVSPVHIPQDSIAHNIVSKMVKMDGETEDLYAYGDLLMYNGVKLKQAFASTGYNSNVRHFQDFASRLYFMEVEE